VAGLNFLFANLLTKSTTTKSHQRFRSVQGETLAMGNQQASLAIQLDGGNGKNMTEVLLC